MNKIITNSPLSKISTGSLALLLMLTIAAIFWIAHHFRNDYDPKRLIKSYAIFFLPLLAVGLLLHIQVVLIVGIYLAGVFLLVFRSNHYFYGR
ncbi:hypothetical protein [Schleiferilactobacillus perolens]|jgi:hypothetical protein|uniref:hypothetical protein n=1 Tax=Schleiferilactobacillus perolens TaxID=100468 RepID=UPI0023538646|nr:hypothetical protein [Schleiferilactobacillus perolens]MCI2169991.1 hypothetical protein [Schleiferilactobacillus perolens]